jgi:uncharacterized protein (TIGR02611 family)
MARTARIVAGFALVVAGVLMLALPGPGLLTILAGLALLARDLRWAQRLGEWMKGKLPDRAEEPPSNDRAENQAGG